MVQHYYKDGLNWNPTNAFWYKDGSTWREMKEVWYNDGGTWRRVHRREIRRPTASTVTNTFSSRTNPTYAYDTDDSTHVLTNGSWVCDPIPLAGGKWGAETGVEVFDTWQTTSNTYNTLKLYISADGFLDSGDYQNSYLKFEVSTDGTSYTQMFFSESSVGVTGSLAYGLSTSQDFTKLKVKMTLFGAGTAGQVGAPGLASASIYDIYTIGTY